MSDADSEALIRRVRSDEVEGYRAFRLRALADSSDAVSNTLAAAELHLDGHGPAAPVQPCAPEAGDGSRAVSEILFSAPGSVG